MDDLLILGDSQSAARLAVTDAQTWGALVAARNGWTHTNCAVGGSTSSNLLSNISTYLAASSGTKCIAMIGANDAFIPTSTTVNNTVEWTSPLTPPSPGNTIATYQSNLVSIIDAVQAAGKNISLVTPWAFFSTPEMVQFPFYVRAMQDIGARKGVVVLDVYHIQIDLWWNLQSNLWSMYEADYQHENAAGHQKIADLFTQERYSSAVGYHT
jgi:lysophospholipase L1-like esterase